MTKKKKEYIKKLRNKYRLVILNDNTFEEKWSFRLSRLNVFSFGGFFIISLIVIGALLMTFTSLREYIPGFPDGNMRRNIVLNAIKADSLQNELRIRDQYFKNLQLITQGKEPNNYFDSEDSIISDSSLELKDVNFSKSKYDSILRKQIEEEEFYNLSENNYVGNKSDNIRRLNFFVPLKGYVTNKFNSSEQHFGTDIVSKPNATVLATLSGTVIMSTWTLDAGYIIEIQHDHGLISVYKHNSQLLKKTGSIVKAGEPIAIIGNTGEYTTGPHLHFELWHKGKPVDAENFIVF